MNLLVSDWDYLILQIKRQIKKLQKPQGKLYGLVVGTPMEVI